MKDKETREEEEEGKEGEATDGGEAETLEKRE